ncbi:MAG TPA: serine/threonine-protein kinase, partial [Nannocystaceae bacterium]|nr:serine/threonine-protein kinase [Nannocystaceae bacterium]
MPERGGDSLHEALVLARVEAGLLGEASAPPRIGRFVVLRRLGHGGMGVVYLAYDEELDRKIAIKLLHAAETIGSEGNARMLREAQSLARLAHPNVVAVHEVGVHAERVYLAMEFVEGTTMRKWWADARPSWRDVVDAGLQAARGLAAAHHVGLVHRDFKPENVLVGAPEPGAREPLGRIRVADFGLARLVADEHDDNSATTLDDGVDARDAGTTSSRGRLAGTPAYMAPEQFGSGPIDARADIFALCVVIWEGLFGERPYEGRTLAELVVALRVGKRRPLPRSSAVPAWVRGWLERGFAIARDDRYASLAAFIAAGERARARQRRRGGVIALGCAATVALAGWGWQRTQTAKAIAACEASGAAVTAIWNAEIAARTSAAIEGTGLSYAHDAAVRVAPLLDARAAALQEARTTACITANVEHAIGGVDADRVSSCLDEHTTDLEDAVARLQAPNDDAVQRAIATAAGSRSIAVCSDLDRLRRLPVAPAERRDAIDGVGEDLRAFADAMDRGEFEGALAIAD